MSPTAIERRRLPALDRGSVIANLALAAVVLAMLAVPDPLRAPPTVNRLHVVNETPYQVEVDVADRRDGPWMALGGFRRESTRTVHEVLDQGDLWFFRYHYGGTRAGDVSLTRSQLEHQGWRVTITPDVGERLRDAGLPPSAH